MAADKPAISGAILSSFGIYSSRNFTALSSWSNCPRVKQPCLLPISPNFCQRHDRRIRGNEPGNLRTTSLDSKLATDLLKLPFIDAKKDEASLATRNMLRGQTFMLPSGENVARHMHRPDDEIACIREVANALAGKNADLQSGTPLWLYLLIEAEQIGRESSPGVFHKGEGLGPVGARIVAETIHGLISLDPHSFLSQKPNWSPADGVGISNVGDMLTYNGRANAHA